MVVSAETESRVLRKIIGDTLNSASWSASRERNEARMIISIAALFVVLAVAVWLLGGGQGVLLPLVVAAFCGVLAIEPFATYRLAATQIHEIEARLLREQVEFNWTKGNTPQVTIETLLGPEKEWE